MARGSDLVEEHAGRQSVSRVEELARIFIHATNVSPATFRPCYLCLLTWNRWKGVFGIWVSGTEGLPEQADRYMMQTIRLCSGDFRKELGKHAVSGDTRLMECGLMVANCT
jgi:hypothetical protein